MPKLFGGRRNTRMLALWCLMLPAIIYFIIYRYIPMGGLIMVFKNFRITRGIFRSAWNGLDNFRTLFSLPSWWSIVKNTVVISSLKLLLGFPAPIIVALMLNEVRQERYKRVVQTVLYLPHFISWVVMGSIVFSLFGPSSGAISRFCQQCFNFPINFMVDGQQFVGLLVGSDIWKEVGWSSIIYLATLSGIDAQMYEAAYMDGANRWQQMVRITLPCLMPTIMTMLLLRVGRVMNAGFEQIFVLQNPLVNGTSEIIDTYVYKISFKQGQYALGAAADLFKSIIGVIFVLVTNQFSKKFDQEVL